MAHGQHRTSKIAPHGKMAPLGMAPTLGPFVDGSAKHHRVKSYVSAERVYDALRHRLGCFPVGERAPGYTSWCTSNGVQFQVDDPVSDADAAAVWRADGSRTLFYSYQYAYALLLYVSQLVIGRIAATTPAPTQNVNSTPHRPATPVQAMNEFIEKREQAITQMEALLAQTKAEVERSKTIVNSIERQRKLHTDFYV